MSGFTVRLEQWTVGDRPLLERLNTPEMMSYLGGPESDEKIDDRLRRYVAGTTPRTRCFKVVLDPAGQEAGSVVYWEHEWRGDIIYEAGWSIATEHQGRGIAKAAVRLLVEIARGEPTHRFIEAFPSVANAASNAVCRSAGFELVGECDVEHPPGSILRCNEWRIDLRP